LHNVKLIQVTTQSEDNKPRRVSWNISNNNMYQTLPKSFDILQGEGLRLPKGTSDHLVKSYKLFSCGDSDDNTI